MTKRVGLALCAAIVIAGSVHAHANGSFGQRANPISFLQAHGCVIDAEALAAAQAAGYDPDVFRNLAESALAEGAAQRQSDGSVRLTVSLCTPRQQD